MRLLALLAAVVGVLLVLPVALWTLIELMNSSLAFGRLLVLFLVALLVLLAYVFVGAG